MNVFAVFAGNNLDALAKAVTSAFPDDHYKLGNGDWLVAANKTTTQAAKLILWGNEDAAGDDESKAGLAIVAKLDSDYWGYHNNDIWEWIALKQKQGGK